MHHLETLLDAFRDHAHQMHKMASREKTGIRVLEIKEARKRWVALDQVSDLLRDLREACEKECLLEDSAGYMQANKDWDSAETYLARAEDLFQMAQDEKAEAKQPTRSFLVYVSSHLQKTADVIETLLYKRNERLGRRSTHRLEKKMKALNMLAIASSLAFDDGSNRLQEPRVKWLTAKGWTYSHAFYSTSPKALCGVDRPSPQNQRNNNNRHICKDCRNLA